MSATRTCRHWIGSDTKGHVCGLDAVRFDLCPKHFELAKARTLKNLEKQRDQQARTEAIWQARNARNLPMWRVTLERAEAELTRRTASQTDDTAAYGGNMHSSITRTRNASLSDTNVARVVELQRIIERLTADIARAEGQAA